MKNIITFLEAKQTRKKININDINELKNASIDDICLSIFPVENNEELWSNAKVKTDNWTMYASINAEIDVYFNKYLHFGCSWYGKTTLRIEHCYISIDKETIEIPKKYKKYFNFGEPCFSLLKKIESIKKKLNSSEKIDGPTGHYWSYSI